MEGLYGVTMREWYSIVENVTTLFDGVIETTDHRRCRLYSYWDGRGADPSNECVKPAAAGLCSAQVMLLLRSLFYLALKETFYAIIFWQNYTHEPGGYCCCYTLVFDV